jgi:hypothetical protein
LNLQGTKPKLQGDFNKATLKSGRWNHRYKYSLHPLRPLQIHDIRRTRPGSQIAGVPHRNVQVHLQFASTASSIHSATQRPDIGMLLNASVSWMSRIMQHHILDIAPLQYDDVDVGEALPARCLRRALWLSTADGAPIAVISGFNGMAWQVEIAVPGGEAGLKFSEQFFDTLDASPASLCCPKTHRGLRRQTVETE